MENIPEGRYAGAGEGVGPGRSMVHLEMERAGWRRER